MPEPLHILLAEGSLYDALVKAGPVGANIALIMASATAVGAIVWYAASKKYRESERAANASLIELHKKRADDAEKEFYHYRDLLHTEKASHQATLLKVAELESRIRELEARPSVDILHRQQTEWQGEQRLAFEALASGVNRLNDNIEEFIKHLAK
jgi:hypothetical protein